MTESFGRHFHKMWPEQLVSSCFVGDMFFSYKHTVLVNMDIDSDVI